MIWQQDNVDFIHCRDYKVEFNYAGQVGRFAVWFRHDVLCVCDSVVAAQHIARCHAQGTFGLSRLAS